MLPTCTCGNLNPSIHVRVVTLTLLYMYMYVAKSSYALHATFLAVGHYMYMQWYFKDTCTVVGSDFSGYLSFAKQPHPLCGQGNHEPALSWFWPLLA